MAQVWQALISTKTWRSSVPCYKRNFRVNFFFSDNFFWVAQMAQWFFELLSLVLLTNRCAKGVGTGWHSQISIVFTRFSVYVLCARDIFFIFKNFFALKFHLQYKILMRRPKKSKYKSVVIKKKRYYFYKITWVDITGDSSHADLHTA